MGLKRFISLVLVVMQLVMLVPAEALAFEDGYTLSEKEVKTIVEIAGTNSVYRSGMKYSASMSAYQKYCWLVDFANGELSGVKNQCGSILLDDGEAAKTSEFKTIYRAVNGLDQLVQYWISDLSREITNVESAQTILKDEDDPQAEKAKAYRRLTKAEKRIVEINREMVEEDPSGFTAMTDQWFDALRELHNDYVTPEPARTLFDDANTEFHVIILNANEIGIQLHTPEGEPVQGATVKLSDGEKEKILISQENGAVVFNTGSFKLDNHNEMWADLYIEKEGMRIYESHGLLMEGGKGLNIVMEPDNGEPYVQYITFRNTDVLHGTETVYQTEKNDVNQSFLVGIHIDSGQKAEFTIEYTVLKGESTETIKKSITVKGDSESAKNKNVKVLDLKDKWCSFLAPKSKVSMELTGNANGDLFSRACGIQTEKAIVNEPMKLPKNTQTSVTGFSLGFKTGIDKYWLSEVNVNFDIPIDFLKALPVSFVITPEGAVVFTIAFQLGYKFASKALEDSKPEKKDTGWQLENSAQKRKDLSDFWNSGQSFKEMAKEKAESGAPSDGLKWMKLKVKTQVAAVVTNKFNPSEYTEGAYKGNGDVFFSVSVDAVFSKSFYFTILGAPCYAGFDFSIGVLGGVDLKFTCESKYEQAWKFWEWSDFDYPGEDTDIIIGSRININGYFGVGIKGLLGACLKGNVSFTFGIHIYPNREGVGKYVASIGVSGSVSLIIQVLIANVNVSIVKGKWEDYSPKKKEPANGASGSQIEKLPEYVQAKVKDAGTFNKATGIRTVQSGDSFYSFYVKNTTISGIDRPWLRCSVIADDGTATELPLPHLGKKALASIGADDFPEDMYVCAFDVASLKDVYNKENGAEVLTLQVIFTSKKSLNTFVESYFLYRRPNGEFQEANYLLHREVVKRSEDKDKPPLIAHVNVNICPHRENADGGVQKFSVMNTFIENDYPLICDTYQQDFKIDPGTQSVTIQDVSPGSSSYNLISKKEYESIEQMEIVRTDAETAYAFVLAKKQDSEERVFMGMLLDSLGIMHKAVVGTGMCSFKCLSVSSSGNVPVALVHDEDGMGRCAISLTEFHLPAGADWPVFTEPRQIVTKVSPAYYDLVDLGKSRALYYLDSSTVSSANTISSNYSIKAVYLADGSDGEIYSTHPFHLADFRPDDLDIFNGASDLRISVNNGEFMHGTVLESRELDGPLDSSSNYVAKYFNFKNTMQVDLLAALVDNVFPKPGETVNLLFPILNTGNVPLSKIKLSVYATRNGSSEHIPLADIEINCAKPEMSSVINYDLDGEVLSSIEGVQAVSQYDETIGESKDTFIIGTNSSSANAYATNVLMPDEKHIYRSSFTVPKEFKVGDYTIHLRPKDYSTLVRRDFFGVYSAAGAWVTTLEKLDSGNDQSPMLTALESPVNGNNAVDDEILTLTASILNDFASEGETVPVSLVLSDVDGNLVQLEEESELLRAFEKSTVMEIEEINLDYADLSIEADLSLEAGQEIVHIYIRNESVSAVDTIKLNCDIDGDECYSAEFKDLQLLYKDTVSIDVPLEKITGGKEGELLNLNISGNHENEVNQVNNTDSVPLLSSFVIILDPSDQYVMEGESATFSVRARGGVEPYIYQWQISMDGQDGKYRNIDGATERDLIIEKAKLKQNGAYIRCVVRDSTGKTLTSNPALLLVTKLPRTGDTNDVNGMLAMMLASVVVIVFMIRRRRRA